MQILKICFYSNAAAAVGCAWSILNGVQCGVACGYLRFQCPYPEDSMLVHVTYRDSRQYMYCVHMCSTNGCGHDRVHVQNN